MDPGLGHRPAGLGSDLFALGVFNADRITNPDGTTNPVYQAFADILTIPAKMNTFPRTIFGGGKDKHYDQITWHANGPHRFSLAIDDCGYFDIDTVLRPGYDMPAGPFSFRISRQLPPLGLLHLDMNPLTAPPPHPIRTTTPTAARGAADPRTDTAWLFLPRLLDPRPVSHVRRTRTTSEATRTALCEPVRRATSSASRAYGAKGNARYRATLVRASPTGTSR